MNRVGYVNSIIGNFLPLSMVDESRVVDVFAPINIAFIKYWGKSCDDLMLPYNENLSITMNELGTKLSLKLSDRNSLSINGVGVGDNDLKFKKLFDFLNLLCGDRCFFNVETINNIPTAAGFASSASVFAALVLAVNEMFFLNLSEVLLSNLARIGSISAGRSIFRGMVKMDTTGFVHLVENHISNLCIGFCVLSGAEKKFKSRENMRYVVENSVFYESWLEFARRDMSEILLYIEDGDFEKFGIVAERNALCMHATIGILNENDRFYFNSDTLALIQKIQKLRHSGLNVFCTMDAGPNVKLLFQYRDLDIMKKEFSEMSLWEKLT
jgi:diphosphomevalonate decarboxylase